MFPTVVHEHQGDPVLNPAHNSMEIRVTDVEVNLAVPSMTVPDEVRNAVPPMVRVESRELSDGIWWVTGGSHHSVVVEFNDFVTVIEAPLNEDRSLAVIGEVTRLFPSKPIRYLVNTHHHFDHSGGLRTYLSQGATIVTHQGNRDFYQEVMFHPGLRSLSPDRLAMFYPMFATSRRPAPIETINQKYVVSDGVRVMEIYPIQGLSHAQNMVITYLPKEKILVNADLYSPPPPGAPAMSNPDPRMITLAQNIDRLGIEVDMHVPIHGSIESHDVFLELVNR
jgi:glyoxylase-like metal-dependent hydrolase (beta-lactamase superfamily II)